MSEARLLESKSLQSEADSTEYVAGPEEFNRQSVIVSEIPAGAYDRTLHIGCEHGFVTDQLPGRQVIGVDQSLKQIRTADRNKNVRVQYLPATLGELPRVVNGPFDLIVISHQLDLPKYRQAGCLSAVIIDELLATNGVLVSEHRDADYEFRFPYLLHKSLSFSYRGQASCLEVYLK